MTVNAVDSGVMPYATIESAFSSPTGRLAIADSATSSAYMRDVYSVKVYIYYDPSTPWQTYRVHTAYPSLP